MKLLVVDDEPMVLRLLSATLPGLGYPDADFAQSGAQALEFMEQVGTPYSCILLDILMPEMNGIELCQLIRTIPEYRSTPIIMLTAMAQKEFIDDSFAAGATDYMNKPVDGTELRARLRVAGMINLERQRSADLVAIGQSAGNDANQVAAFGLSEAIQIDDAPRVVNSWALENYLFQLDRKGQFGIGMIGFQLRNASNLHASLSPGAFYDILADVAEAISENTRVANALISYAGNGCFVAVVPRIKLFDRRDLEDSIALTLHQYLLADQLPPAYEIKVDVGSQVNGSLFGKRNKTLVEQAICAVQGKANIRSGLFSAQAWALTG
jgi:CheY-like chemotaxis protein